MNIANPRVLIQLEPHEKEQLQTIYNTRSGFLSTALAGLLLMALWAGMKPLGDRHNDHTLNKLMIYALVIIIPLLIFAIVIFRKRVHCYKIDARNNVKEKIAKIIVKKSHFPLTGQYFISFDDPDYMHHEVDEDFYYACSEDTIAYLYRAPKSKYVFNKNGMFSLM